MATDKESAVEKSGYSSFWVWWGIAATLVGGALAAEHAWLVNYFAK